MAQPLSPSVQNHQNQNQPYIQHATHWDIFDQDLARQILDHPAALQAGFGADAFKDLPSYIKPPMLFSNGEDHRRFRQLTVELFNAENISQLLLNLDGIFDDLFETFKREKRLRLNQQARGIASLLIGQLFGLDRSASLQLSTQLERFFRPAAPSFLGGLGRWLYSLRNQQLVFQTYRMIVRPAIQRYSEEPGSPLISKLVEEGYSDLEITTELMTYAAVGVTSLRVYLPLVASRLLEDEDLKALYLSSDQQNRQKILTYIAQLKPPIPVLERWTASPITLSLSSDSEEGSLTIPAEQRVALFTPRSDVTDADPVSPVESILFGYGPHLCPAQALVLSLADRFMLRLFEQEGLQILQPLRLTPNPDSRYFYDISDFIVGI